MFTDVASSSYATPIDETKLPPAATNHVDFLRDIKPILDASCLKCHGPEKPKSHFRVDDRAALLKGGDDGVAVIAGQSAKSPLIHYVARLVPDMEMPPAGKGESLTAAQIGLLRAWIDQEMPWTGSEPVGRTIVELAPTLRWWTVRGDERKFRELNWQREGWNGGAEDFLFKQQLDGDRRFTMSGHALRDDYKLTLSLEKSDRLFMHAGFEQFRKYYDDSGGYYAPYAAAASTFAPITSLGRDLHLDLGKAWVEAGGVTPFGLHLTGGYEFQFKDGNKSLTQWKPVGPEDDPKNILPVAKSIDEQLHVLRLDAEYDLSGVRLEDRFRYEFYDLRTGQTSVAPQITPGMSSTAYGQSVRESQQSRNLANAFTAEVQPLDWLLLSAGHLYTHTDGEAGFHQAPVDATGQPRLDPPGLLWTANGLTLEQHAHVFNANAQLGLWEQMTFSAGVQTEWNHQHTFGQVNLDQAELAFPNGITNVGPASGDYDRYTAEEKFLLRNTQIPFTVLYGEVRFRQETIRQMEELNTPVDFTTFNFARDTEVSRNWRLYRTGFNISPASRVSLNAYYQRRERRDDFDHLVDDRPYSLGYGYPAFITARDTTTDEAAVRLSTRLASWLKTTLSYRLISTDYETTTDLVPGTSLQSGEYDAHIYSFNATLTPWRRLYFFSTLTMQDTRTITADNGSAVVAPFRGRIYSAMTSAHYLLTEQTDLNLSYDFSSANYSQNNAAAGLPLGINYRSHSLRAGFGRRFWKRFSANVEYVWAMYDEPSSAHHNDYTAHGVFATLRARWD